MESISILINPSHHPLLRDEQESRFTELQFDLSWELCSFSAYSVCPSRTRLQTWRSPTVIYVLILLSLAAFIAFTELQEIRVGFFTWASSFLGRLAEAFDRIGRFTCEGCFFLAVACLSVGCGYQLHVLGFFTVFHFQLCGSCGLVINEQLSWPLQVVETSLALCGLQYILSICLSAPNKITKVL
ncbi:hypothetical protein Tco_0573643 [Tanacetum coccineum]